MFLAVVLALSLQRVAPAEAAPSPVAPSASGKGGSDPIECREEMNTGSHFKSETCLRTSQWRQISQDSVDELGRRDRDLPKGGLKPH